MAIFSIDHPSVAERGYTITPLQVSGGSEGEHLGLHLSKIGGVNGIHIDFGKAPVDVRFFSWRFVIFTMEDVGSPGGAQHSTIRASISPRGFSYIRLGEKLSVFL